MQLVALSGEQSMINANFISISLKLIKYFYDYFEYIRVNPNIDPNR